MKRILQSFALGIFVMFSASFSCGQNGPSPAPTVTLNWTQSTTPGITKNCIYRGTVSGTYSLPGTCIPAATTYTDTTAVPGSTYFYAVTAQVGAVESNYSVSAQAIIPASPNAPTGLQAPVVAKNETSDKPADLQASVQWVKRR
jgi:hypothetical protein